MSPRPAPLPEGLGPLFSVATARELDLTRSRLRAKDFAAPRRGVRRSRELAPEVTGLNTFERCRAEELRRILEVAEILQESQFLSHRSAALLWQAPVPHRPGALVHASVLAPRRSPRAHGVVGHNLHPDRCAVTERAGIRLTTPAITWAQLGELSVPDLVVLGDFLVRKYRAGYGRRSVGKRPLATTDELASVLALGRWPGAVKLRRALELIREDSWSPQESLIRLQLGDAGVPEPELNVDVYDDDGVFLACIDMVFREYKVGVEYQSDLHSDRYAKDVERIAALRHHRWNIIEATRALNGLPGVLTARVFRALRERGWPGAPRIPRM